MKCRFSNERKPPYRAIWDQIEIMYSNYYYCLVAQKQAEQENHRNGPHPVLLIEKTTFYWETILCLLKLVQSTDEGLERVGLRKVKSIYLHVLDLVEVEIINFAPCIEETKAINLQNYVWPYHLISKGHALAERAEMLLHLFLAMEIPEQEYILIRNRLSGIRMLHKKLLDELLDLDEAFSLIFDSRVGWDEETLKHMRAVDETRRKKIK
jgi:hypothetical protein